MIFYDSHPVSVFFNIKFCVSSSLSYCWAIRPPLSFSSFLCSFALQPPLSLPPTLVLFPFLSVSLFLCALCPSFCQALQHFSSLTLPLPLSSLCRSLSLKLLVADGTRALITLSLLVSVSISGRSHSLSPRHRLPTAPRNKHTKWLPARGFCLRRGWRKSEKNRGFM